MAVLREEAFVDSSKIESVSGLTYGVTRPTKHPSNPLLTGTPSTYQHHVVYVSGVRDPDTDQVRLFYGNKTPTWGHGRMSVAVSDDGVAFTKPNLGLFTLDGNTNNNCVIDESPTDPGEGHNVFPFVTYWEGTGYVAVGQFFPYPEVNPGHWYAGIWISQDGVNFDLVQQIDTNVTTRDAMGIIQRDDGKWIIYMQSRTPAGHPNGTNIRSVGYWLSTGTDLATTGWNSVVDFMLTGPSLAYQYYSMHPWRDGEVLYAAICIFNIGTQYLAYIPTDTTNRQWKFELWTSRADDGLNWTKIDGDWLYAGTDARNATLDSTPGEWDYGCMIGGGAPVHIDDDWFWYYGGAYEQHHPGPAGPNGTQPWQQRKAGAALIPYRRLGKLTGTGTVVLDQVTAADAATVTVNSVGTVEAELLDASGSVIPGYARADCDTIPADTFDHTITWNGSAATPSEFKVKLYLTGATVHYVTAADIPLDPPTVTDPAATATAKTATVAATVNPNGEATTYHVEWGETESYGQETDPQSAGSGTTAVDVEVTLTDLDPETTYHARLVAMSAGGVTTSSDVEFTTAAPGIILDRSATWTQTGTSITVRALTGRRTSCMATVLSPGGGAIVIDGADAGRFDVEGEATFTLEAGVETRVELGVTPLLGDDMLTCRIGVPQ